MWASLKLCTLALLDRAHSVFLAFMVGASIGISLLASVSLNAATSHRNCQQIEKLKAVIRQTVQESGAQAGRSGTAGYAYYQSHPKELQALRVSQAYELREFAPSKC